MLRVSVAITKNELAAIKGQLRHRASQAVRKAALDVQAHAQQHAPVDTGLLRGSIQVEMETDLIAIVGTNVHYAPYQEYGTSHGVPPHPFMTPAINAVEPSFKAAIHSLVK